MLSAQEVNRIDETMTLLKGNRSLVAQSLGIPLPTLQNYLKGNSALAAKWLERVEAPVSDANRTPVKIRFETFEDEAPASPPGVTPAAIVQANAQNETDRTLQRLGWEGLGITGPTAKLMESFEQFTGGKILRTIDATHGGMMFGFAKTAERFEALSKELDDHKNKVNELTPEMEALKHTQFMECADQMRKFNAEATKAAHVRALIAEKANEQMNQKRNKKAGWDRRGSKRPIPIGSGSSKPPATPNGRPV